MFTKYPIKTVLFIDVIFESLVNHWGLTLFSVFKSYSIFLACVILSAAILIIMFWKIFIKGKTRIFSFIILLLIVFFVLILPFERGNQITNQINLGKKVVNAIERYETENNTLPERLNQLAPMYLEKEIFEDTKISIKYDLTDYKKYNELYKNSPYFNPRDRNTYSLIIKSDILGFEFLRYDRDRKEFVLTDK